MDITDFIEQSYTNIEFPGKNITYTAYSIFLLLGGCTCIMYIMKLLYECGEPVTQYFVMKFVGHFHTMLLDIFFSAVR